MKFNLKNFPRTIEGENRDDADLWVEGFEKELRELKNRGIVPVWCYNLIEEILGE